MQASQYGIQNQYINAQNFMAVAQHSKRRNILYDNYLQILQKIFTVYKDFYEDTQQLFKVKIHQKSIYVEQLKSFLRKFGQIIRDTSLYQVDTITQIRVNKQETINRVTSEFVSKIQTYSKSQRQFKTKLDQVIDKKQEVMKNYTNLKSQVSEASAFYNKQTKTKVKAILQKIDNIAQSQKQLETGKKEITSNAQQFEQYLLNFRKRLLQNKYNMLHRMTDQSKHFRNCLTQILLLLVDCVNSKMQTFMGLVKNPKDDTITITQSRGRKKGQDIDTIVSNLINSIQEYYHIIDEVIFILKGIDTALKKVQTKTEQILQNYKKYFLDNLNIIYPIDQTPLRQVNDTLDLYQYYTSKIVSISDKMYQCSNRLTMLKQNVKKHADVTLSLIRSAPKNKEDTKIPQVDQVYNQISYDFVTEVISEVYKAFKETLGDLKTYFNQRYYKKKKNKVQDSMEISHVDETVMVQKKKPCKKQLWLWRDWRDKTNFTTQSFDYKPKQISQFLAGIKFQEQSKQLHKYDCIFYGKKDVKGVLKICEKSLQFVGITGSVNTHLCIPYNQISSVQIKVRIFQKYIAIETEKGELGFSKFLDILSVQSFIKQNIQKSTAGAPKVVKKAAVQILPQQLDFIQKNKTKINQQRPNIEGMMKLSSFLLQNVTVDQVYEYIYSDKPFTIRGKPEDSFFAFYQKKQKNYNYVAGSYDKPGPQFYSRVPQIKWTNCPPFSTRVNQFDRPLPQIPFMPKFCHCIQKCNIHWLSHQSFDYFILSQTVNAPYCQNFNVRLTHRIFKEGTGVRVQLYGGVFILQQFAMKGIVKSKGQSQLIQSGKTLMDQIQKTMNIVTGNAGQPQKQQTKQGSSVTNTGQKPSNQVNKLKNQNKLLIIALVVVFLINILLRFVLS